MDDASSRPATSHSIACGFIAVVCLLFPSSATSRAAADPAVTYEAFGAVGDGKTDDLPQSVSVAMTAVSALRPR